MLRGGPGLMDRNGPGTMAGTLVSLTIVSTTRTESLSTEVDAKFPKGNGMMYQVQLKGSVALFVHTKFKSKNIFSCEDAAQQVLLSSVRPSVRLSTKLKFYLLTAFNVIK